MASIVKPLSQCATSDVAIPDDPKKSKSKKLLHLDDMWFFIREADGLVYVYEVSTKKQIFVTGNSKAKAINILVEHLHLVKEALDEYEREIS